MGREDLLDLCHQEAHWKLQVPDFRVRKTKCFPNKGSEPPQRVIPAGFHLWLPVSPPNTTSTSSHPLCKVISRGLQLKQSPLFCGSTHPAPPGPAGSLCQTDPRPPSGTPRWGRGRAVAMTRSCRTAASSPALHRGGRGGRGGGGYHENSHRPLAAGTWLWVNRGGGWKRG